MRAAFGSIVVQYWFRAFSGVALYRMARMIEESSAADYGELSVSYQDLLKSLK